MYVNAHLVGSTPLPFDERLPEGAFYALVAPGRQVFLSYGVRRRLSGTIELPLIPEPDPAAVSQQQVEVLSSIGWEWTPERWVLSGPGELYPLWIVSPDDRHLALVARGSTEQGWGVDLLMVMDLETGQRHVLGEQLRYPTANSEEFMSGFWPVGWRDAEHLLVMRTTQRAPGAELILALEEYRVGEPDARRLAELPAAVILKPADEAWIVGEWMYLNAGHVFRVNLESGLVTVWPDLIWRLATCEDCGPAFVSPDGERVLGTSWDLLAVGLVDVTTGQRLSLGPSDALLNEGDWSPDSKWLAFSLSNPDHQGQWYGPCATDNVYLFGGAVLVTDRDGHPVLTSRPAEDRLVGPLKWDSDGNALLVETAWVTGDCDTGGELTWTDAGLFRLTLDGQWTMLRPSVAPATRSLVLAHHDWILEYDSEAQSLVTTVRGAAPPPVPDGLHSAEVQLLPGGSIAVLGEGGKVWICTPGAAECREERGFALTENASWPVFRGMGPWLTLQWSDELEQRSYVAGVRYGTE